MRVETTYYAFDDEVFYSEEECLAYEERTKQSFEGAIFYDEATNKLNNFTADDAGDIWHIKVLDAEKTERLLRYLENYSGFQFDTEEYKAGDILAYDEDKEGWININRRIEYLQKKVKLIDG